MLVFPRLACVGFIFHYEVHFQLDILLEHPKEFFEAWESHHGFEISRSEENLEVHSAGLVFSKIEVDAQMHPFTSRFVQVIFDDSAFFLGNESGRNVRRTAKPSVRHYEILRRLVPIIDNYSCLSSCVLNIINLVHEVAIASNDELNHTDQQIRFKIGDDGFLRLRRFSRLYRHPSLLSHLMPEHSFLFHTNLSNSLTIVFP